MTVQLLNLNQKLDSTIPIIAFNGDSMMLSNQSSNLNQLNCALHTVQKDTNPAKDIQSKIMSSSIPTVLLSKLHIITDSGASNHCSDPILLDLSICLSSQSAEESTACIAG